MKLNDYLVANKSSGKYPMVPKITCVDGFTLSVQCGSFHYCIPREDHSSYYEAVEVGFPSATPNIFHSYAENYDNPTETVYGYVPINLVAAEINSHGGIEGIGLLDDVIDV